jgi:hypothetical protein
MLIDERVAGNVALCGCYGTPKLARLACYRVACKKKCFCKSQ